MKNYKGFRKKALFFLVKFFVIYGVLQAAILAAPIGQLKAWIAGIEAGLLGLPTQGNLLFFNGHVFEIAANCTGLMSAAVLAAIIFSLKKPDLKKKIALFAVGSIALFALNIARIYTVLLAAISFSPESAETLHIVTWFVMAGAILALWYWLTKRIAGTKAFSEML